MASEWLDGLLMLLNQAPITTETNKMVEVVGGYGLKIRLLNVRMDLGFEGEEGGAVGGREGIGAREGSGVGIVPSREGLGEDYFYEALV